MSAIIVLTDLRARFGPARNQGPRPTCLAFAASDAHASLRNSWKPLSCEYAFYHSQRRAGRSAGTGALLSSMLEALRQDGQPIEDGWPYLVSTPPDEVPWMPPPEVGELFGRNGQQAAHQLDRVIEELDQGRPVIVLLMLSQSFYTQHLEGVVDPASDELPEPQRRHAVIAVGHGTVGSQRALLIRNSWGPTWGRGGYAWLTERFVSPRIFAAALLLEEVDVSARSFAA